MLFELVIVEGPKFDEGAQVLPALDVLLTVVAIEFFEAIAHLFRNVIGNTPHRAIGLQEATGHVQEEYPHYR